MNEIEQQKQLGIVGETPHFIDKLREHKQAPLRAVEVSVLQINLGKLCNLQCKHCHVNAGPDRKEIMTRDILESCLNVLKSTEISTIDITGGAPEMNPHLEWFLYETAKLNRRLMVRTNLVILASEKYTKYIDIYTNSNIEIVTSLPDYIASKSDRQRGEGTFQKIVSVMKQLNERGYGVENSGLVLDLVHNPVGAYLPGNQDALELEYKTRLKEEHGVIFNNLFSITNIPVGRYLEYLVKTGNYEEYIDELANAFNPLAAENVMCKSTISVAWDGTLYDCDFNQMLNMQVSSNVPGNIKDFDIEKLKNREIVIHNHCYGCVAGSGSSCQGVTVEE